jgi:8-amino-7-oxononanoate synthase
MLAQRHVAVYLDAGTYPIARWGVERAAARGTPVLPFAHRDPDALRRLLRRRSRDRQPVVVSDGICPRCGRVAPIAAYLDAVSEEGGLLVLDDTQALGLLGHSPGPEAPYGQGGGGSFRWTGIGDLDMAGGVPPVGGAVEADPAYMPRAVEYNGVPPLVVASLAKGFGVPMAVLFASLDTIRWFQDGSETRVHCSPPSVAAIRAAEHALTMNAVRGDDVRLQLAHRVGLFRQRLAQTGLTASGGLFPVQTVTLALGLDARVVYERLLHLGVRTVLRNGDRPGISLIITARHLPGDIEHAVEALARAVRIHTEVCDERNERICR